MENRPQLQPPLNRTGRIAALCMFCITAAIPSLALAGSATVNIGFNGVTPAPAIPAAPATITTTYSPVFQGVQTSTELDSSRIVEQPAESAPAEPGKEDAQKQAAPVAKSSLRLGIGIDTLITDNLQIYTMPVSYSFNRNFSVLAVLPVVTAKFPDSNGVSHTNTGIGDVSLTFKHRIGSEREFAAFYTLLTGKFASGNADKGLGTGTYDISLTEKVITRFGDFRVALMGGVTQPLNNPNILGSKVEYGTVVSYMASLEHPLFVQNLWFGVRADGLHSFETKIDSIAMGNALTTLDLTPEFNYYFKRNTAINLGVNVPVYTDYALQGASSNRKVAVRFGVTVMF